MKTFQSITLRLILGVAFTALLVTGLFAVTLSVIPTWGATDADVARSLPGDELVSSPNLLWTNAITIDASPEDVWPWIAQIGDSRAGFYSYTFIENKVGALTGSAGYNIVYTNADEIHPDWQDPQPRQSLIDGSLQVRESEPGRYLLAESVEPSPFLWIWCWYVEPVDGGAGTRLLSRFAIKVPDNAEENPVMDFMLNVGGFVMHQNMMQSIKLRAEGRSEPAWIESLEVGLWMAALLSGLVAAILYLIRKEWRWPLLAAILSVLIIFVLTFVQPSIVVRFVLDTALIAAVVWAAKKR